MENLIKDLFYKTYGVQLSNIIPLSAHGSARRYFRILSATDSILATYNEDKKENIAFVDYAKQLKQRGLNVPEIIAVDLDNGVYFQEDLGDETLFDFFCRILFVMDSVRNCRGGRTNHSDGQRIPSAV